MKFCKLCWPKIREALELMPDINGYLITSKSPYKHFGICLLDNNFCDYCGESRFITLGLYVLGSSKNYIKVTGKLDGL